MTERKKDLVLGLDSSTQSTKCVAWTREGDPAAEARAPHDMAMPAQGWAEQDPAQWWSALCTTVREVVEQVGADRIAGLAISNQRETSAFLDAEWNPIRPAIVWVDERGRSQLKGLAERIGAERMHRITGKPFDLTPPVSRFDWLREHEPETLANAAHVVDAQCYLLKRLSGEIATSWISADPSGVFDIEAKAWSGAICQAVGLRADQLAPAHRPGGKVGEVTAAAAAETGLEPGTPLFLAGGDGQCSGLGVNAMAEGTIYLNLGTALLIGAWTPEARISKYWRTMTSPTGEGYFCEGVQRTGAMLLNWMVDLCCGGRQDPGVFARMDEAAAALPLGAEGVTMSPYLSGCMDPHWDPDARAAIVGLAPNHGPAHLYRAALEALTAESARCLTAMAEQGLNPQRIVAVGGGASNKLWMQMFADASGLPVARSRSVEASALGAGMIAAAGLGWHPSIAAAAEAMSGEDPAVQPDPQMKAAWAALLARQAEAYRPQALAC